MNAVMLKRAETFLNQSVLESASSDLVFKIYYWGAVYPHYNNPLHKHSFFEICYVLDGEGEYIENEQSFALHKGVIFCSRPELWHQIKSKHGLQLWYVAFEVDESHSSWFAYDRYQQLASSVHFLTIRDETDPTTLLWKALLIQATDYQRDSATLQLIAHSLLSSFQQLFVQMQFEKLERTKINDHAKYLEKAKKFIQDNLSQPLAMEDVANYLHISTRHLSRLFATQSSMTFTQYVHIERLNRAIQLLKASSLAIKQITEQCGFQSVHYFSRLFRKHTGVPPALYRRGHSQLVHSIHGDAQR